MKTLIVTRHPALVEYLLELGLADKSTPVLSHATATDVEGKHVLGVLPLSLAVHAAQVTEIPLILTPEMRGQELSLQQVRDIANSPATYRVEKVLSAKKAQHDFQWSDKIGPRRRKAWLLLIKGDQVFSFVGKSIPGVVVVVGRIYEKAGIWSADDFHLRTAEDVRAISGRDGWETGRFIEGLTAAYERQGTGPVERWADVALALGINEEAAKSWLREWRPKATANLDRVEEELTALSQKARRQ